jgi:inactivated superfamily I helicase
MHGFFLKEQPEHLASITKTPLLSFTMEVQKPTRKDMVTAILE